ncbi:hypothetical protein ACTP13_04955 [Paenibacillus peoriae]
MAPLRSVSELLGAKVEYNMKSQEAVINWKKRQDCVSKR